MSSGLPPVHIFSDEWVILQFLKRWKPSDIRRAIDEDVDLAALMLGNWAKTRFLSRLAKRNQEVTQKYLSSDNVLYWFSVRRPDLYSEIVKDSRGSAYIKRNFDKVRGLLFNQ